MRLPPPPPDAPPGVNHFAGLPTIFRVLSELGLELNRQGKMTSCRFTPWSTLRARPERRADIIYQGSTPRPTMRRSQRPAVGISSPSKIGLRLPFSELGFCPLVDTPISAHLEDTC
jgi:hypothetical protein